MPRRMIEVVQPKGHVDAEYVESLTKAIDAKVRDKLGDAAPSVVFTHLGPLGSPGAGRSIDERVDALRKRTGMGMSFTIGAPVYQDGLPHPAFQRSVVSLRWHRSHDDGKGGRKLVDRIVTEGTFAACLAVAEEAEDLHESAGPEAAEALIAHRRRERERDSRLPHEQAVDARGIREQAQGAPRKGT